MPVAGRLFRVCQLCCCDFCALLAKIPLCAHEAFLTSGSARPLLLDRLQSNGRTIVLAVAKATKTSGHEYPCAPKIPSLRMYSFRTCLHLLNILFEAPRAR